jgi:hypothetical protein
MTVCGLMSGLSLPGLPVRLPRSLSKATGVPRAAGSVMGAPMPPVPMMPATPPVSAMTMRLAPLAMPVLSGLRRSWALLGCGNTCRTGGVRRIRCLGIVAVRHFGPAVCRSTVIRMTLFSQWLWPFLMERLEKPHWRDK